jgi:hypothetical protein
LILTRSTGITAATLSDDPFGGGKQPKASRKVNAIRFALALLRGQLKRET